MSSSGMEAVGGPLTQVGDLVEVRPELGIALREHAEQYVGALPARGRSAGALARVHPLVGEAQRLGHVVVSVGSSTAP